MKALKDTPSCNLPPFLFIFVYPNRQHHIPGADVLVVPSPFFFSFLETRLDWAEAD